jgi:DNA-binding NtrC family response regulator
MLTGQATVETAVEAMKHGAFDYRTKPFPLKELESLVQRAREYGRLRRENRQLRALLERAQSH